MLFQVIRSIYKVIAYEVVTASRRSITDYFPLTGHFIVFDFSHITSLSVANITFRTRKQKTDLAQIVNITQMNIMGFYLIAHHARGRSIEGPHHQILKPGSRT